MDLALNNLQWLICHKINQPTNQPTNTNIHIHRLSHIQLWEDARKIKKTTTLKIYMYECVYIDVHTCMKMYAHSHSDTNPVIVKNHNSFKTVFTIKARKKKRNHFCILKKSEPHVQHIYIYIYIYVYIYFQEKHKFSHPRIKNLFQSC